MEYLNSKFGISVFRQDIDACGWIDRDQAACCLFEPPEYIKRRLLYLFALVFAPNTLFFNDDVSEVYQIYFVLMFQRYICIMYNG